MIAPSGFITIDEALGHIGAARFGAAWTHDELSQPVRDQAARSRHGAGLHPETIKSMFPNQPMPSAEQQAKQDELHHKAERLGTVQLVLLRGLESRLIASCIVDPSTGWKFDLDDSYWRRAGAIEDLSLGSGPLPFALGGFGTQRSRGLIFISAEADADGKGGKAPSHVASPPRRRGAQAEVFERVKAEMAAMSVAELDGMKEEEMKATFNASRDTCRRARNSVMVDKRATNLD